MTTDDLSMLDAVSQPSAEYPSWKIGMQTEIRTKLMHDQPH